MFRTQSTPLGRMKFVDNLLLAVMLVGSSLAFQRPALVAHRSALFSTSGGAVSAELVAPVATKKSAVIVGGGPVGLATALTLSNAPHFYDVTLVEQSPETASYDPTKAYLYLVNPRGQVWTKRFPRVQELLEERGSCSTGMGNFLLVPGDPSEPLPSTVAAAPSNGEASYWIPRHGMVTLLEQAILEQEEKRRKDNDEGIGSVQVLPSKACLSMEPQENGQIEITVQDTTDPAVRFEQSFVADLIVGADGANSAVRSLLSDPPSPKTTWLTERPKKFKTHSWMSAASGLRMKVLQFPPAFTIPPSDLPTESERIYAIRSVNTGPRNYLSLGLLPVRDPTSIRPTNVITRPNHDLWKLQEEGSGASVKAWFEDSFPRFDFENLVDDAEWERFASAKGTTFPKCQYCTGMQVTSPNNGNTGVVLVGDAIHAFPPDIGQGINAGLSDVESLDRALKGKDIITGEDTGSTPATLAEALETYERVRAPEVKALIRLARFGSPYQYKQPTYRDRVARTLWTMNVAVRVLLNKLTKGLIPQAAIISAMDKSVTYRKLMRRADITTVALYSAGAVALGKAGGVNAVAVGGVLAMAAWFITYWFGR